MRKALIIILFIFNGEIYLVANNPLKLNEESGVFGNSWHVGAGYSFSRSNELDFSLGRTFGYSYAGRGNYYRALSYGMSYAPDFNSNSFRENGKVFCELSFLELTGGIPKCFAARLDYLYDFQSQQHFIRPSIGVTALFIDVLYNYSFSLNGPNDYGHGITIRLKYFLLMRNWTHENSGVNYF